MSEHLPESLADCHGQIRSLNDRLEIQRDLTIQSARECEAALGRARAAERRLTVAEAELTAWEESSDVIGPVLPVADQ